MQVEWWRQDQKQDHRFCRRVRFVAEWKYNLWKILICEKNNNKIRFANKLSSTWKHSKGKSSPTKEYCALDPAILQSIPNIRSGARKWYSLCGWPLHGILNCNHQDGCWVVQRLSEQQPHPPPERQWCRPWCGIIYFLFFIKNGARNKAPRFYTTSLFVRHLTSMPFQIRQRLLSLLIELGVGNGACPDC